MRKTLNILELGDAELQSTVDQLRGSGKRGILKLPAELLHMVFKWFVLGSRGLEVTILLKVCKQWRIIVSSTDDLWVHFPLHGYITPLATTVWMRGKGVLHVEALDISDVFDELTTTLMEILGSDQKHRLQCLSTDGRTLGTITITTAALSNLISLRLWEVTEHHLTSVLTFPSFIELAVGASYLTTVLNLVTRMPALQRLEMAHIMSSDAMPILIQASALSRISWVSPEKGMFNTFFASFATAPLIQSLELFGLNERPPFFLTFHGDPDFWTPEQGWYWDGSESITLPDCLKQVQTLTVNGIDDQLAVSIIDQMPRITRLGIGGAWYFLDRRFEEAAFLQELWVLEGNFGVEQGEIFKSTRPNLTVIPRTQEGWF